MDHKVQIPRVAAQVSQNTTARTTRACESCRQQKSKCSGQYPCQQCERLSLQCLYGETKRQKTEREFKELANKLQKYRAILQEVKWELCPESARRVDEVLRQNAVVTSTGPRPSDLPSSVKKFDGKTQTPESEDNDPGFALDYIEKDFTRDWRTQATGFLGDHSAISWLFRLRDQLELNRKSFATESEIPGRQRSHKPRPSMNYSADDIDIPVHGRVDTMILPPREVADKLATIYFRVVHPFFPIISKVLFYNQLRSLYKNKDSAPGNRWQAILNLVFAMASKCKCLTHPDKHDVHYNDTEYFCRAWRLTMSDFTLSGHPDLQQVQVEGLLSLYLASIGQLNRSWRICGMSIQSAITMGIHLRNESRDMSPLSKENRCWVWWSLYTLDIALCVQTGRCPTIGSEFISTPLPLPFDDEALWKVSGPGLIREYRGRQLTRSDLPDHEYEQSDIMVDTQKSTRQEDQLVVTAVNHSSDSTELLPVDTSRYFLAFVELTLLMRRTIEALYAPARAQDLATEREKAVITINTRLDEWLLRLLPALQFQGPETSLNPYIRQRLSLALRFYSTKILLFQTSLMHTITNSGRDASEKLADSCVESVHQMLSLFPEQPDPVWVYNVSPWWDTTHYLMQSMTILLMELYREQQKRSTWSSKLELSVRKSVRWLQDMSILDAVSRRAWEICNEVLLLYFPAFIPQLHKVN